MLKKFILLALIVVSLSISAACPQEQELIREISALRKVLNIPQIPKKAKKQIRKVLIAIEAELANCQKNSKN